MQSVNLTQHFLIAMPAMTDPHFSKSLTFICEHNDQGALGVVVNRPIDMTLHALLEQIEINNPVAACKTVPVHYGGPVQIDRGFVLHTPAGSWKSTLTVGAEIGLTTSKDILEAVARGTRILFETPAAQRYDAGLKLLGINLAMLSDDAGHA
jgi:putative transcriptional regulator